MRVQVPTVQWRIMVRQLPLLILLFASVLLWLEKHLKNAQYSTNLELARISSLATVYAVQASARTEHSHQSWEQVVQKIPRYESTQIEIVNTLGKVLFSPDPTQRGTVHRLQDPPCVVCHENGRRQATTPSAFIDDPEAASYQVFAAPLRNDAECRPCHSQQGTKLGMVFVRQSLEPTYRQVRTIQIGLIIAGGMALILTVLTTRFLLARFLGQPLRKLVDGARAIGAGELKHTIDLPRSSELSVLADTLNVSARRLEESIRRLERQRDHFETLYRLADQLSRSVLPDERTQRAMELASQVLEADCALIQASFRRQTETFDGTFTSPGATSKIVAGQLPANLDGSINPLLYSSSLVRRWLNGEFDHQAVVREEGMVAYPLQRPGRRLGLFLVQFPKDRVPEYHSSACSMDPDSEIVQGLCKHLEIMLEFSEVQRELVAQERLAAVGETVAGIAHCLKNLLNGLRAGVYVTDRALEKGQEEKLHAGWRVLKNSIQRVERFTFDMLYYVKDRIPRREPTDLNEVIREVLELQREAAAARGVELRAELDEGIGPQPADRTALYRAFLNLVSNALDACVESESGDLVVLRSRAAPGEVVVTVTDNGTGMSEEVQSNLFVRFFSTKGGQGTGLGLPVVKKIVEEHGGTVEVESKLGQGSTFRLRLRPTGTPNPGNTERETVNVLAEPSPSVRSHLD